MSHTSAFRLRHLLFSGMIISFLALFARSAHAQDPPPDLEAGLKPFGSFHGGDIDTVSMSQGSLSVHIPLLGYSQRGALYLNFNIFYTNYTFGYKVHCTKDGICTDTLTMQGVRNTYVTGHRTQLPSHRSLAADHGSLKELHRLPCFFHGSLATDHGSPATDHWPKELGKHIGGKLL